METLQHRDNSSNLQECLINKEKDYLKKKKNRILREQRCQRYLET